MRRKKVFSATVLSVTPKNGDFTAKVKLESTGKKVTICSPKCVRINVAESGVRTKKKRNVPLINTGDTVYVNTNRKDGNMFPDWCTEEQFIKAAKEYQKRPIKLFKN